LPRAPPQSAQATENGVCVLAHFYLDWIFSARQDLVGFRGFTSLAVLDIRDHFRLYYESLL
jgi:hypothetical protein